MNANELMLGNYVQFGATILVVSEIYATGFYANNIKNQDESLKSAWTEIKPVPLTEKWLVDFGLGKENGYHYNFLNGFIKIRNSIYFFKYYDLEVELIFVHQLQNLHFSLTGNHLRFVEPK